jgi:hypothetical protein
VNRPSWHLSFAFIAMSGCFSTESADGRTASEAAERAVQRSMSIADVIDIAAAQNQAFSILGICGPEGALNIGGDGGDAGLWVARGSPSGGDGTPEHRLFAAAAESAAHRRYRSAQGLVNTAA